MKSGNVNHRRSTDELLEYGSSRHDDDYNEVATTTTAADTRNSRASVDGDILSEVARSTSMFILDGKSLDGNEDVTFSDPHNMFKLLSSEDVIEEYSARDRKRNTTEDEDDDFVCDDFVDEYAASGASSSPSVHSKGDIMTHSTIDSSKFHLLKQSLR